MSLGLTWSLMRLEDFHFLLTPDGQQLLDRIAATPITADSHLRLATELRQQVGSERTNAVLETVLLRQKAAKKFSRAAEMYFTREALEQSSAEIVSTYRTRRFGERGFEQVADLGCGIGGDALALAAKLEVTGVDWDPLRLVMAQENVRAYGHGEHFRPLQADLMELSPLPVDAIFADPSRRDEYGRRSYSVHHYRPPIDFLVSWRQRIPHLAVKVSPAVDYAEIPPEAEAEFISVKGEVREAVLWFGELRTPARTRATLLPGGDTLEEEPVSEVPVTRPRAFLYEPDGAVIRAHLVEHLAWRLGASKIDKDIAYLTAMQPQATPFARCYSLEGEFPFQLKRLRHYLRDRNVGQVTIKKRGSPIDPDMLQKRLRLSDRSKSGREHRVIFLTKVKGEATVLVGRTYNV